MRSIKRIFLFIWLIPCIVFVFYYRIQFISFLDPIFDNITDYPLAVRTNLSKSLVLISMSIFLLLSIELVSHFSRDNHKTILSFLFISLITLINLFISFRTVLRRDDYWEINDAKKIGFFGFVPYAFMNLSGRFSDFFLKSFYAILDPLIFIRISIFSGFVFIFIISNLFVNWYCITNAEVIPKRSTLYAIATVITSGVYLPQTKIWESFYWGSGFFVYGIGIPFTLSSVFFLLRGILNKDDLSFIISLFLGAFSTGFVQLTSISICLFSVSIVIYFRFFHRQKSWCKKGILFSIIVIVFTLISFLALEIYLMQNIMLTFRRRNIFGLLKSNSKISNNIPKCNT